MNLSEKRFCIFGIQGSGKTVLMHHILRHYPKHLVVTPHHDEYKGCNRYLPTYKQYTGAAIEEINMVINKVVIPAAKKREISLFAIDEANTWTPNKQIMPRGIKDLNDNSRHYHLSFGVIARRPTQIHTDLVELAHHLFVFRLTGKNDYQYLESIVEGLGDVVRKLAPYHFALVDEHRNIEVIQPVPLRG